VGYRGGFCEKLPEASLRSHRPMPVGSKTDLPLAKAEPMSNSGSTSWITDLRRKKKKTPCGQREE